MLLFVSGVTSSRVLTVEAVQLEMHHGPRPGAGATVQVRTRLGQVGTRLGQVGTRLGQVGTRFGQVGTRLGQVGTRLGQVGTRLGQVGTWPGHVVARFGQVQNTSRSVRAVLALLFLRSHLQVIG